MAVTNRERLLKFLISAFYLAVMALMVFYVWNKQQRKFPLVILCFTGICYIVLFLIMLETVVRERTRKLEEQISAAAQANRAKSEFLATMSHEIRTPLNAVIGLSEIELRGSLPEPSRKNISLINRSGTSLLRILNDILDISKIEAGELQLIPVEYESAPFISDTVNLNRVRIGSKPIDFVLEIDGDFPRKLSGDELRIKQILNNILSNAIKYTQEGKVMLTVTCGKREKEALLRFAVRDTGIGVRSEDLEGLFSLYVQLDTKTNREIEGTGLGLPIAKKLVEMMGGSITVESEYGKGSCFIVEIIQGLADSAPIGEEIAGNLRNFSYIAERKKENFVFSAVSGKVLVADDQPANLRVTRGLLKSYSLQVDTTGSGEEALDLARAANPPYDLIFMDHMMPGMDGVKTARAIRAWEQENGDTYPRKQVPIVALTANALRGMKEFYLENGFQDYLSKPIIPQLLDNVISRWLPVRERPTENKERLTRSIAVEMEIQRLDMLNHYRASFESGRPISDNTYFEQFTALIESFDAADLDSEAKEQVVLLREAGRQGDAPKIREALPAFYETLCNRQKTGEGAGGEDAENRTLAAILPRLKKAVLGGETEAEEAVMREMGTLNLGQSGRELYFLLYDLLLTGDNEKAVRVINLWEKTHYEEGI
jgi:signal transduction histidine kinase/CheY-like chemotaxis protein